MKNKKKILSILTLLTFVLPLFINVYATRNSTIDNTANTTSARSTLTNTDEGTETEEDTSSNANRTTNNTTNATATTTPGENIFTVKITSNVKQTVAGNETLFKVSATNISAGQGVSKVDLTVTPDKNFEEMKESDVVVLNQWKIGSFDDKTGKLSLTKNSFQNEAGDIVQFVLKTKEDITDTQAKVQITNLTGSNGRNTIKGNEVTGTIEIGATVIENSQEFDPKATVTPTVTPGRTTVTPTPITMPVTTDTATDVIPDAGLDDTVILLTIALSVIAVISMQRYTNSNRKKLALSKEALSKLELEQEQISIDIDE